MKYTVVGIYEGNDQKFTGWYEADGVADAIAQAPRGLMVAGVIEGEHKAVDLEDPADDGKPEPDGAGRDYTVFGIYDDTDQRFCDTYEAEGVEDAIEQAPYDLTVAGVFEGDLTPADKGTYYFDKE